MALRELISITDVLYHPKTFFSISTPYPCRLLCSRIPWVKLEVGATRRRERKVNVQLLEEERLRYQSTSSSQACPIIVEALFSSPASTRTYIAQYSSVQ
ncbi:hypothetical protein KP509_1Z000100 [Ceratopteris richardii]|nr:hypothetical protein KP509_1Z000100 [Ceratopteris richardii]